MRRAWGGKTTNEPASGADARRIGPYVLHDLLGRGGQGSVYVAEDTRLGRRVALKVLEGVSLISPDARARFAREAKIASTLDHPGLCPVLDAAIENNTPYIAMRLVPGKTLASALKERSGTTSDRGTTADTVRFFERAARALHAAHEAGIIHRDLKPGNIIVTPEGEPVLLDFGLARSTDQDELAMTATGGIVGTPAYMAPEQLSGVSRLLDGRTDVYALGICLFETLTLEQPFVKPTREATFQSILSETLPNPRSRNSTISRDLAVVVATATSPEPNRRYQTARAFADDLARVAGREPIRARPSTTWLRIRRWAQRRPAAAALITVLAITIPALAALSGYLLASRGDIEIGARQRELAETERLVERGYFEIWEGSPQRAARTFRAAIARQPGSVEALGGLVLALHRAGKDTVAIENLEANRTAFEEHRALQQIGEIVRGVRNDDRDAAPVTALDHFMAGVLALDRRRDEGFGALVAAIEHFEAAIRNARTSRPLYFLQLAQARGLVTFYSSVDRNATSIAKRHVLADNRDRVAECARILQRHWPERAAGDYWAGFAWADVDVKRAIRAYERALEKEPSMHRAMRRLLPLLAKDGRDADAMRLGDELIESDTEDARNYIAVAMVHEVARRFDRVLAVTERALALQPDNAGTLAMRGTALLYTGQLREARQPLRRAVAEDPSLVEAWAALGAVESELGNGEKAMAHYQRAVAIQPTQWAAQWNLASTAADLGRYDIALAAVDKAIEHGGDRVPKNAAEVRLLFARRARRRANRKSK